jgi:hypothetical protein
MAAWIHEELGSWKGEESHVPTGALRARQGAESIARKILKARQTDCNDFLAFTRISHHKDFPPGPLVQSGGKCPAEQQDSNAETNSFPP